MVNAAIQQDIYTYYICIYIYKHLSTVSIFPYIYIHGRYLGLEGIPDCKVYVCTKGYLDPLGTRVCSKGGLPLFCSIDPLRIVFEALFVANPLS